MKPGFGNIQNIFSKAGSSSWTPLKPLGGETPSYWYKDGTRSGLTLPNSISPGTGDETITLQRGYCDTNGYAVIADNGSMDIINNLGTNPLGNGDSGYTLCGWIKSENSSKTFDKCFLGKMVYGAINGRFGITAVITTGLLTAYVQSSGGTVACQSSIDVTTVGWTFVLMDVNYTTKKLRFFINNVQIGSDTSFTGTLAQLSNSYNFYISAFNTITTGTPAYKTMASYRDVGIYNKILTSTQQTTLFGGGYVTGLVSGYLFDYSVDGKILDIGTGGKHLTPTNTSISYDAYGSRRLLDLGYTRWVNFPNKDIHIAYSDVNIPCTYNPVGYTKDADIVGSSTSYNKASSYVSIVGLDRSNPTICSYLSRAINLQHYYMAAQVSYLHSNELNNKDVSNYFNDNYRGMRFIKESGGKVIDLIKYATNKTSTDYEKVIKWTKESILKFDVIIGPHICAVRGSQMLRFDDIHTLSLSNDNGTTYPISLVVTCNEIVDAFFYDNGNIGFSDNTKCYYSDDNLASYQESTVLDINGDPFVAGTLNNFRGWMPDFNEAIINGVRIRSWGTYATGGTAEFNNINQWYTIDGGVTIKSGYKFGASSALCRHLHQITYDVIGGVWYMTSGDGDGANTYNNFFSGSYNTGTDIWSWTLIGSSNSTNSLWQSSGMCFDANYLLISHEVDPAYRGIMRILRSDVANIATNQELIFATDDYSYGIINEGGYYIMPEGMVTNPKGNISFSADGERYFSRIFANIPLLAAWGGIACRGKLSNGYYLFFVIAVGETVDNYTIGSTLLIKPSVIS